jgi:cytochrome c553
LQDPSTPRRNRWTLNADPIAAAIGRSPAFGLIDLRQGCRTMTDETDQMLSARSAPMFLVGLLVFTGSLSAHDRAAAQMKGAPRAASICAPCHGLDGIGRNVATPNIAGQNSIYLRKQLAAFRSRQRQHPDMRYVARELTERELDALVVYYSQLPPP